ncbi:unnamed protein product [Dracunculus medinensis]|uniref:Methylase_S domain-containing protein n=1 Tax=Dracunculus medinensis TaxID=318479 RepID=A0A0N4U9L8_DRAME|nr:unnamed protein product [Dracunculus medinensis]
MTFFERSKPVISKIRVVAGDPPVALSPSGSMVKGSDILHTISASHDVHDTPRPVVHSISIQSGLKAEKRYWLYHCGAWNNSGQNGIAIVMAHSALIEWKPVSDRIAYARFKSKLCNISVINIYVPTLSVDDRDKDKFYAELQLLIKFLPEHDTWS